MSFGFGSLSVLLGHFGQLWGHNLCNFIKPQKRSMTHCIYEFVVLNLIKDVACCYCSHLCAACTYSVAHFQWNCRGRLSFHIPWPFIAKGRFFFLLYYYPNSRIFIAISHWKYFTHFLYVVFLCLDFITTSLIITGNSHKAWLLTSLVSMCRLSSEAS